MTNQTKQRGKASDGRGVQSVEIGAKLLTVLARHGKPMTLKDLAGAAGIVAAQAHPYLVSFRQQSMVEQDAESGRYRLGRFALELGIARMSSADPMDVAHQSMRELSAESGVSVILSVWGSFGPTVVRIVEGNTQLYMSSRIGTVYSLSGTASGQVFAAFLPEGQTECVRQAEKRSQDQLMRVGVPKRLTKADLAAVRDQGFAMPPVPVVPGILGLAAPVFDLGGQLQFAMALVGRGEMQELDVRARMADALLRHATELSERLGFLPD